MLKTNYFAKLFALTLLALWLVLLPAANAAPTAPPSHPARLLLAHYMPWFQADPSARKWGWHWTMNHFDPNKTTNGHRQIASLYYPLIGPYDSSDRDVVEYQALLMKLAGFDGAVLDWSGTDNYYDYATNNGNDEIMSGELRRAGLRYAILYDDNCVRQIVLGGRLAQSNVVLHGQKTLEWLQDHWFSSPSYVELNGKPLFLVFGGNGGYYQGGQWDQIFAPLKTPPAFFTELGRNLPAIGGFGWPVPDGGTQASFVALDNFYSWYVHSPNYIACAYPRFDDVYAVAGVQKSWGTIDDRAGKTYEETLTKALKSSALIIQVATWNDWGEGTQIEPSAEFGYRDLETTQRLRKKYIDTNFPYTTDDLRLPAQLYRLRKAHAGNPTAQAKLDNIAQLLFGGQTRKARAMLATLAGGIPRQ